MDFESSNSPPSPLFMKYCICDNNNVDCQLCQLPHQIPNQQNGIFCFVLFDIFVGWCLFRRRRWNHYDRRTWPPLCFAGTVWDHAPECKWLVGVTMNTVNNVTFSTLWSLTILWWCRTKKSGFRWATEWWNCKGSSFVQEHWDVFRVCPSHRRLTIGHNWSWMLVTRANRWP